MSVRLQELYAPIQQDLHAVRRILERELASDVPFVQQLCEQVDRLCGKMLRPALLLLSGRAIGPITDQHRVLAAVVEMVHVATLVHDDVLDEADLRRNARSLNRQIGNEGAVLLGDFLISHAFHLCSSLDSYYASRLMGAATNTVCEGELMQVHLRGDMSISEDSYLEIIARKTAALTSACCALGARAADGSERQAAMLEAYGFDVGMAFQIVDDLLDLVASDEQLGKSTGVDLDRGELTLPIIHLLQCANADIRRQAQLALSNGRADRAAVLRDLARRAGSLRYAEGLAHRYVHSAIENLADLPRSEATNALAEIADYIPRRQR
jgi:octaprenyl-diphosphate synthase